MKKLTLWIVGLIVLIALIIAYGQRGNIKAWYYEQNQPTIPAAEDFSNFGKTPSTTPTSTSNPQPTVVHSPTPTISQTNNDQRTTINLAIPFTSQAPLGIWDAIHEETCEEAAILMVDYYYSKKTFTSPQQADDELLKIVAWENNYFGFYQDTSAAQTAEMVKKYFGFQQIDLVKNPTVEVIKKYLNQGLPVIIPTYGKILPNPNFTAGGPLYHMLVIKGYTPTTFITNDPGTRKGADFQYTYDDLMNAIHDWNNGDVPNGDKVIIIVRPN